MVQIEETIVSQQSVQLLPLNMIVTSDNRLPDASLVQPPNDGAVLIHHPQQAGKASVSPYKPKQGERKHYRFSIPFFLSNKILEFNYYRSISEWHLNLGFTAYRIVPYDSPIFKLSRRADIAGVRRLFETGQALPYDVDASGQRALGVSYIVRYSISSLTTRSKLQCSILHFVHVRSRYTTSGVYSITMGLSSRSDS